MDTDKRLHENISALADGELAPSEQELAFAALKTPNGMAAWRAYHLIGDTLRDGARGVLSEGFNAALVARLAREAAHDLTPFSIDGVDPAAPPLPAAPASGAAISTTPTTATTATAANITAANITAANTNGANGANAANVNPNATGATAQGQAQSSADVIFP